MDQNTKIDLSEIIRVLNHQFIISLRMNAEILAKITNGNPETIYNQFSDLYKAILAAGTTGSTE